MTILLIHISLAGGDAAFRDLIICLFIDVRLLQHFVTEAAECVNNVEFNGYDHVATHGNMDAQYAHWKKMRDEYFPNFELLIEWGLVREKVRFIAKSI